jgi:hypothetical protein
VAAVACGSERQYSGRKDREQQARRRAKQQEGIGGVVGKGSGRAKEQEAKAESVARIESRAESKQDRERSSMKSVADWTGTGERAQEKR